MQSNKEARSPKPPIPYPNSRATATVAEGDILFQTLAEMSPTPMCIVQGDRIIYANSHFLRIVEYTLPELQAMPFWELAIPGQEQLSRELTHAVLRGERRQENFGHAPLLTRTGEVRWLDISAKLVTVKGENALMFTAHEISDIQAQMRERQIEIELTKKIRAAMNTAQTRAELGKVIVREFCEGFSLAGGVLVVPHHSPDSVVAHAAHGVFQPLAGKVLHDPQQATRQALASGMVSRYGDGVPPELAQYTDADLACVPVSTSEQGVASLWVAHDQLFTASDFRLMLNLAGIAANALHRIETTEALELRVSERTAALEAANTRLRSLDRLKSRLVSDVSHELRAPVANLSMYVYLLEHDMPDRWPEHIAALGKQVNRLKAIIENILDFSRLEQEEAAYSFTVIDLNHIVGAIVEENRLRAEANGLNLVFAPSVDIPRVVGDPDQVAQVVENLVTNAINYTHEGQVIVRTQYQFGLDRVCLGVKDTGRGISPEERSRIFDRGYRGENSRDVPGTGLGLNIVREIVEAHRGNIDVESELGQGTTFTVYFVPADDPQDIPADEKIM